MNKELAPPTTAKGYYHIDLYDPPGVTTPTQSSEAGGLIDLVQAYINEIMHNIYCHRLFLWEQVSDRICLLGAVCDSASFPSPPPSVQDQYIEDGVEWEYIPVQTNDVLIEAFQQVTCLYA